MPYIDSTKKDFLDQYILKLEAGLFDENKKNIDYGSIVYLFFKILYDASAINKRFTNLNSLIGTLESCKIEFADKVLKPYEMEKLLSEWAAKNLGAKLIIKKKKRAKTNKAKS